MIPLTLLLVTQTGAGSAAEIAGDWMNERRTAIVRIDECPSGICGSVVWSAAAARQDAARGGTSELNGTTVMFAFNRASPRHWRGKLYLPDQRRTIRGTLRLRADGALDVRGCELGAMLCKTQRWTRWTANQAAGHSRFE